MIDNGNRRRDDLKIMNINQSRLNTFASLLVSFANLNEQIANVQLQFSQEKWKIQVSWVRCQLTDSDGGDSLEEREMSHSKYHLKRTLHKLQKIQGCILFFRFRTLTEKQGSVLATNVGKVDNMEEMSTSCQRFQLSLQ